MATMEDLSAAMNSMKIPTAKSYSAIYSLPLSFEHTPSLQRANLEFEKFGEVDATLFINQPWICTTDTVRHRRRGILITHDTFNHFNLSFDDDYSSGQFLGDLLGTMAKSGRIVKMSELQLEELNSMWDDTIRIHHPQFTPVDRPLLVCTKVTYSLSPTWEIVKTLYYIAISQDILNYLFEHVTCNVDLTELHKARATPLVKEVPNPRQQQHSPEIELERAIKRFHSNTSFVNIIVERLVDIIKVGRRERSEPFLNLTQISIPRILPRESIENLGQAIKFVHTEEPEQPTQTGANSSPKMRELRSMRVFLVRRLVGSINEEKLDSTIAKALRESTALDQVYLKKGMDRDHVRDVVGGQSLYHCARTCYAQDFDGHVEGCIYRIISTRDSFFARLRLHRG